jgi:hypothetical protein
MCAMTDQSFRWYAAIPEPGEWWVYDAMLDGPRYSAKRRFNMVGGPILPKYKITVRRKAPHWNGESF